LFIKKYIGYESLGLYGLLWRFGAIFQMAAIAMVDTWSILAYSAQKEHNGDSLLSKLITYYSTALTTINLYAIIIASFAIACFFPHNYYYLIYYLPTFFLPLLFIEIARVMQTSFGLSIKTMYMPLLSLVIVILQILFLMHLTKY